MAKEIVGRPKAIQRARLLGIDSEPRLPLAAPVKQTHRTGMQVTTKPFEIVAAEAVLIPPVLHALNVAGEDEQERWQRSELVDPVSLLDPHPSLELLRVAPLAPLPQIDHHHAVLGRAEYTRVEVDAPQLRHVIHDNQVGVEVDDSPNRRRKYVAEVHPRVVQRLIQRTADRVRDLSAHEVRVEVVEVEG
ncbi:hypothetical protein CR513_09038, partial [Mucuna pruriens]